MIPDNLQSDFIEFIISAVKGVYMIGIENLHKSYGGRVLFDDVSFRINSKEKIGLVGRNGHGKTTLLRILTGREGHDGGTVSIPKNHRMGYVRQVLKFSRKNGLARSHDRPDPQ